MSILHTVRTATRSKHDAMENLIGSEHIKKFSILDYQLLLGTNFLFHLHLEKVIQHFLKQQNTTSYLNGEEELNFEAHIKSISLEKEANQLFTPSVFQQLKQQENTIIFSNFENLLGWLYVAEGSMLGGKTIYKILSKNTEIALVTDFDFYKNYEHKTSKLWNFFTKFIEEKCKTPIQQEDFLDGAEQSYSYFEKSFYKVKNILEI